MRLDKMRWMAAVLLMAAMMTASALAATATVKDGSLILRQNSSRTSKALQTIREGTEMDILAVQGDWYKVRYGRYTGYVMARYVKVSGELPKESGSASSSSSSVLASSLRPGSSGNAVKELQRRLKALGYYTGSIDGDYGSGTKAAVKAFQLKNGLTADGIAGAKTMAKLNGDDKNSQSSSDKKEETQSVSYSTLRPGDVCSDVRTLQTRLKALGYYTGHVDASYGSGTTAAVRAFQKQHKLTADGVAGPATQKLLYSTGAEKADQEALDSTLRIGSSGSEVTRLQNRLKALGYYTGSADGNYGEATAAAVKAFQQRNGLTADGEAGTKTREILYGSSAKEADDGTLRPGDSGSDVKNLQSRLKKLGYYDGSTDGDYGDSTTAAVKAFQQRNGLTADGVAGASTLEKLNSAQAVEAAKKTESLVWFTNGNSALPKNAVFTVKDVKTGKTFKVKRWSGSNHADCEPLTKEDTAIMKEIYGGSWSWTRRAILVSYNGHVYAASMNGMPHGTTTINGNNFDGHFCIHFTGSRTHETNRVDEDHQDAVQRALKAVW